MFFSIALPTIAQISTVKCIVFSRMDQVLTLHTVLKMFGLPKTYPKIPCPDVSGCSGVSIILKDQP